MINKSNNFVASKFNCFKIRWIQKLKVYKAHNRLFIVGSNTAETKFRILKIDRTEPWELFITEDGIDYTKTHMTDTLLRLYEGNNGTSKRKKGLTETLKAHGIVGFVRFLEGYYMICITKQSKVAEVGGHSIYKIEDTSMIYLPNHNARESHPDEARYLRIFQTVDLSSNFYFSYSYDLSNSLQHNLMMLSDYGKNERQTSCESTVKNENVETPVYPDTKRKGRSWNSCTRFMWNNYLLEPLQSNQVGQFWMIPIIHGHVSQSCINVFGKQIYITIIGRRSSLYAGTRFMKRGCNINGDVANEIETEQIVHCASTSSLHHTAFTSYVQHRGSVPVHWQQDITANVMPSKPPINITTDNPYAQSTAKHFEQMMSRFGTPIYVLNLVRKRERRFRESILGYEYKCAIDYLNQFLKSDYQIKYFAVDMAHLSRGTKSNVLTRLAHIAENSLQGTGFFQSKPDLFQKKLDQDSRWKDLGGRLIGGYRMQTGILRTNCVDCLDRTNSAQFVAGKCALAYQLYSLGVLSEPDIDFETDITRLYEEMFEAHGDIVALQYGGSQLVHTIQSYRRTVAPWASHSRDIVTTISRYYTNTFSDADKQSAINLFLGVFRPTSLTENLWDIPTDHYLHNEDSQILASFSLQNYTQWWDPVIFLNLPLPFEMVQSLNEALESHDETACHMMHCNDMTHCRDCTDWYDDFYNPSQLTVFEDCFALNLTNTRCLSSSYADKSPFAIRGENWQQLKQEHLQADVSSSQVSLDTSSNGSSDSEGSDSPTKRESLDCNHLNNQKRTTHRPPWLRTPCIEDFSPKVVYGIDLENCTTADSRVQYQRYISCREFHDQSFSGSYKEENLCHVIPPKVDAPTLRLYKDTVSHTYHVDHQFYVDYLSQYKHM